MLRILLLCLLALPLRSPAQPQLFSLEQAKEYGVRHNYTAKNARLDAEIQILKNREILGTALPQISAQGRFLDYVSPLKTFVPNAFFGDTVNPAGFTPVTFTPAYNNTANLNGAQLLFNGSLLVALQARNTILRLYDQTAQASAEEVRYNVQTAYYSLVVAQKQFGNIKQAVALTRSAAHDVRVLRESGFAEKIDVDRSEVQLYNLVNDSLRIANLLRLSERVLKFQMSMDIDSPIVLTDTSLDRPVSWSESMLSDNPPYDDRTLFRLQLTQVRLTEYDIKRYKYQNLPTLTALANASYSYSSNTFKDLFTQHYIYTSFIGLQLDVPIFDGLQRRSRVRQAKLTRDKAVNNLENLKLAIDFQTDQSKTSLRNALLMSYNSHKTLELAYSVLDLAKKKYTAGVGSNLEVTQAAGDLLNAQTNYYQSLLDVVTSQSNLQRALGQFKSSL